MVKRILTVLVCLMLCGQAEALVRKDRVRAVQSGTWDIDDITGTISLPTGAATSAKQLADGHSVAQSGTWTTQSVQSGDWTTIAKPYGPYDYFAQDASTEATITIDYAHHEVHSGSHFYLEGYALLGNGGSLYIKLVTPDNAEWAHFTWDIASNGILITTLVEAPTGGLADGSPVTILNNNRNSDHASVLTITSGVTAPIGGTIIAQGSWGSKAGGQHSRDNEIILKQGTTYARTFLSGSASNYVNFKASWYEHTDKN